jgi:hypothetical protein
LESFDDGIYFSDGFIARLESIDSQQKGRSGMRSTFG